MKRFRKRRGIVDLSQSSKIQAYLGEGVDKLYSRSFLGNGNNQIFDQYLKGKKCFVGEEAKQGGKARHDVCLSELKSELKDDRTVSPTTGKPYAD